MSGKSSTTTITLGISSSLQHHPAPLPPTTDKNMSKMENADDDDDDDAMSISPAAVHFHPAMPRPTRESVLQRLSEALLRRSLAKVRYDQSNFLYPSPLVFVIDSILMFVLAPLWFTRV